MEKYGVSCKCQSGEQPLEGMLKVAEDRRQCGQCGHIHRVSTIEMKDEVKIAEKENPQSE